MLLTICIIHELISNVALIDESVSSFVLLHYQGIRIWLILWFIEAQTCRHLGHLVLNDWLMLRVLLISCNCLLCLGVIHVGHVDFARVLFIDEDIGFYKFDAVVMNAEFDAEVGT